MRPVWLQRQRPGELLQPVSTGTHQPSTSSSYHFRAVQRVCDILDHLMASEGDVSLPEIAQVAELPKTSAFRYLVTLQSRRYVERNDATGSYRLGLAFLPGHQQEVNILAAHVRPVLEELREELGETVSFGVLDGGQVTYVEAVESRRAVRLAARQGGHDPIHSTAVGKAISAELPEDRVRQILASEGMAALTSDTIIDAEAYLAEIAEVRRRGYAVEDAENEPDARSVAVPMPRAPVPAAISLSAPVSRLAMDDLDQLAKVLREASQRAVRDGALAE